MAFYRNEIHLNRIVHLNAFVNFFLTSSPEFILSKLLLNILLFILI